VPLAENENVIQTIAPDRTDEALGEKIGRVPVNSRSAGRIGPCPGDVVAANQLPR
jgi:hypothetical protein